MEASQRLQLRNALFPVEITEVYVKMREVDTLFDTGRRTVVKADRFRAVVDTERAYVFSVVAPDYRLVTNAEAVDLGRACFSKVFKITKAEEMEFYNLIMPGTRSFCHIDFLHQGTQLEPFDKDVWQPYLRVSNSYNRTLALNFDIGFCRGICKNGVIFGKRNIVFKFVHSRRATDPQVEFSLRAGELQDLEKRFVESLFNLQRFHVPRRVMWALACRVFGVTIPPNPTPRQSELLDAKAAHVSRLTLAYFDQLGENGYAALNVLTDFASRPSGMISPEASVDTLQRKAGAWIEEFVLANESRSFSFDQFLGPYAGLVA